MLHSIVIQTLKLPASLFGDLWRPSISEPEIERTLVCSSMVSSIGFQTGKRALQVEFNNGFLYRVDDISFQTYRALMQAENFDRYYRDNILHRFEMTKIGALMPMGW